MEDELQHQQEEEEPLLLGMVMEMEARGVARALLIDEQVAVLHHPPARTAEVQLVSTATHALRHVLVLLAS